MLSYRPQLTTVSMQAKAIHATQNNKLSSSNSFNSTHTTHKTCQNVPTSQVEVLIRISFLFVFLSRSPTHLLLEDIHGS